MCDRWFNKATFGFKYLYIYILHSHNYKYLKKIQGLTIVVYWYVAWSRSEGKKLYVSIVMDLALSIMDTSKLLSLSDYVKEWRLIIWEIAFFREFKSKDGIWRNKVWE
jgi:hypothetical protein